MPKIKSKDAESYRSLSINETELRYLKELQKDLKLRSLSETIKFLVSYYDSSRIVAKDTTTKIIKNKPKE